MFTGLVEEIGKVKAVIKSEKSGRITLAANKVLTGLRLGDSISTNGVCLTVTEFGHGYFSVDVMGETMRRSNLKNLKIGDSINLERALKLGDRLGGHIVSGHIDGTGAIINFQDEENAVWITVKSPEKLLRYIIEKGSIAIDGVSLTVAYADNEVFKVSIIPHTKDETTLVTKRVGDEVNLECDIIGKYIEKLINPSISVLTVDNNETIDMDFLGRNGFL